MTPGQQDIVQRIRASAEAIRRAVAALPAEQQQASDGEWTAQEVLAHTLNAELFAFDLRIRRMLVEDDPQFADYNEVAHRATLGALLPVNALVQMLVAEHELLAQLLSNLPTAAWHRTGHHAVHGARTVEYFARRVAEHAEEHAEQIAQMVMGGKGD